MFGWIAKKVQAEIASDLKWANYWHTHYKEELFKRCNFELRCQKMLRKLAYYRRKLKRQADLEKALELIGEAYQLAGWAISGPDLGKEMPQDKQVRLLDILGIELPEILETKKETNG